MKNTKRKIFETLAVTRQATISKLAEQLELNPITVRHHLLNLEREGLITSSEQRHGVGRPHLVFQLTGDGQQAKKSNYHNLAHQLLSSVEETFGQDSSVALLETIGKKMAQSFEGLPSKEQLPDYLDEFCDLMAAEGFNLDWEMKENRVYLHNSSCPYHHLNQTHPEICAIDRAFFTQVLGRELQFENGKSVRGTDCVYSFEV